MKQTFTILFLMCYGLIIHAAHLTPTIQLTARCEGKNEVPAVTTDGYGLGVFTLSEDRRSVNFIFQAAGLSGDITGIHIHEGSSGTNGGVVLDLTPRLQGNMIDTQLTSGGSFQLSQLLTGNYYLNVHTAMNPGGEVRGQINVESDMLFGGQLLGSNEVPIVVTNAKGYAQATMQLGTNELKLRSAFDGLSGPITGAHLHLGEIGVTGGVLLDLGAFITGTKIEGSLDVSAFVGDLMAGNVYLNIHTALNPLGELRAQLTPMGPVAFEVSLSGANEVPAVMTDATGYMSLRYNPMNNSIAYEGYISPVASAITGAHFHIGGPTANGPVSMNISSEVREGTFMGTINNVSSVMLNQMLSGQVYVNIHSEDNPSGEIRGQVARMVREGYVASINAASSVPSTSSSGTGVAMLSIDNAQNSGHFMMVFDGVSKNFSAAHFHDGGAGTNGGVLFDLTPFVREGRAAFGYWTMMGDAAVKARTSGIYVNVHTTDNPNGEIRGDIVRGSNDYTSGVGVIKSRLFASSNTTGSIGIFNSDYDGNTELQTVPSLSLDADGIYYDKKRDVLYQANRVLGQIDAYNSFTSNIAAGIPTTVSLSSTADFFNAREMAYADGKLIVAQDADAGNLGNQLFVYKVSETEITLEKTYNVDINLWGIQYVNGTLWAIEDNSSNVCRYDNFLSSPAGDLAFSEKVTIEGLVRTHGIFYNANTDVMYLTDVGAASSPTDGAIFIIESYSTAAADGVVSTSESVVIAGSETQLGNPVDIDYDMDAKLILVAERANGGGKILGFSDNGLGGNVAPTWAESFAGASAIFYSQARTANESVPVDPQFDGSLLFAARLSGSNEVPAVNTSATGVVGLLLEPEFESGTLNLSVNGLSSPVTGIHFHTGASGVNGPVITDLSDLYANNRISTTIELEDELLEQLVAGNIYINVHTVDNPMGEIRGQVLLEQDASFVNWINGAQEVPAVSTDANGLIAASYTGVLNALEVNAFFKNLSSNITGAHLHIGAEGENGPVVYNLSDEVIEGNRVNTTIDASAFRDDLFAGNIYLNIHTENNPGGEIRAQLNLWEGISADGWASGYQEVPQVVAPGIGIAAANLAKDGSAFTVWAVSDALSGDITGAHIHDGAVGTNGPVLVDLSSAITDGDIIFSTDDYDFDLISKYFRGELYINIHTAANPGGEIRAQLIPTLRDGYNFDICTSQENHDVSQAPFANGGGIVSLDRKKSNIHLMSVVSGTSAEVSGVHLHNAPMGNDGGVVFDLSDRYNNGGIFLYDDSEVISESLADQIMAGDIYINYHTSTNPSGELRGQIVKTLECDIQNPFVDDYIPFNPEFDGQLFFAARLSGANEVPAVQTDALGVVGVLVSPDFSTATFNLSANLLSSSVTGVHLHVGQVGENGPVIINLTDGYLSDRITTSISMTKELLVQMIQGRVYINVHTENNPNGEIRGQIVLEKEINFTNWITGMQEVPTVNTDAIGLISANFTPVQNTLEINVAFKDLSSAITGAHLHQGSVGENGPVVLDLSDEVMNNMIRTTVDASSFVGDLINGNIYLNIHTEDNPAGEIRAQLTVWEGISADAWVNGVQEVPAVTTTGLGLVALNMSEDMSTITVWGIVDNLFEDAMAAHIHTGQPDENGGVWLDLSSTLVNGTFNFSTTQFDTANISDMLMGNIYFNAHNELFPGGEVRGQLVPTIRDGYNFGICKEQETGAVTGAPSANGGAILSLDRKNTNIHLMSVVSRASGDVTGVHLHNAAEGSDGPVVLDLTDRLSNGGIFLYDNQPSIETSLATQIRNGEIYINYHTELNPAGELRGQVVKTLDCDISTSAIDLDNLEKVSISPNPVQNYLTINHNEDLIGNTFKVVDAQGKIVIQNTIQDSRIDLSILNTGMYTLMINGSEGNFFAKFIKI